MGTLLMNGWRTVVNGIIGALLAAVLQAPQARAAEMTFRPVQDWAQLPPGTKWHAMTAVDIDSKGRLYVFQRTGMSKVMVFDSKGRLLRSWGEGAFPAAHGLRIDRWDNVWITDRALHQVLKYTLDGKLLMELGTKGVKGDNYSREALNGPSDVVVARNGDIFVSDGESTNTRVVKYSKDGKLIKFWGTKGTGPGQLDVPHSIVIDSKGRLFVADRTNKRVQIFDQDGNYLDQLTNVGAPYGLHMTRRDVLYVADGTQGSEHVTIVDTRSGKLLGQFSGLTGAHMLTVDSRGAIYVAEVRGESVKKFVVE